MPAILEHANITVTDPAATAAWMEKLFDWKIRWEGPSMNGGHTKHVGTKDSYVALYSPGSVSPSSKDTYSQAGGLNHLAVVVDDIDSTERAVKDHGFKPENHADYEPGRRFYFYDDDNIEYEVVQYD